MDSYHPEFAWVADITEGIHRTMDIQAGKDGVLTNSNGTIELKIVHMDTKRNTSEAFKAQSAQKAKELIESWRPDVVIAADDSASKYLIEPHFKLSSLPVVFCGINWDASVYGFPTSNITGMVEVTLMPQTLKILAEHAKGDRLSILAADTLSEHKTIEWLRKRFGIEFEVRYVDSVEAFKTAFVDMQKCCDMLIMTEITSLPDFDEASMASFCELNTSVPTGSMEVWMSPYVLVSCAKRGQEQGEWAAKTAMEILGGTSPADIPVAQNKQAEVYLNMRIAKRLGIKFPFELVDWAKLVR